MFLFAALSEQSLFCIPAGSGGSGAKASALGPVVLRLLLVLRHPTLSGCRLHGCQDHLGLAMRNRPLPNTGQNQTSQQKKKKTTTWKCAKLEFPM